MEERQEKGAEGLWHRRAEHDSQRQAQAGAGIICVHLCHPACSVGTFHKWFFFFFIIAG